MKKLLGVTAALATISAPAFAAVGDSALTTILAAFDITTVATFVTTAGAAVIAIAFGAKGIQLVKRMLGKTSV